MYKECKTEQSAARQRELALGFLELMKQMPYEKISVSTYCGFMQIPRKTFYRYFSAKADVLELLVKLTLMDIGACPLPGGVALGQPHYEEMVRFFSYWPAHPELLDVLLENSLMEIFYCQAVSLALSEMDIFRKNLAKLPQNVQESVVAFYIGGMFSMLMYWRKGGFSESPEEMAHRLLRLVRLPDTALNL